MKSLLILSTLFLASCGFEYSDGTRTGMLHKLSKKGFFCKTWEGTLKTGYMTTDINGAVTSEEFRFSVEDENLAQELTKNEGKKLTLTYVQKKFNPPCSPDSQYRVTKFEENK